MKNYLLIITICFLSIVARAQSANHISIKGSVIDSVTNKPVGYVTVAVTDAQSNQPVKSGLTKDDGSFDITNLNSKAYKVSLIFVGYQTKIMTISGSESKNFGKILLSPSSRQLKEVAVTAAKPVVKQEVDRISYDIQADPESKALTALEMMRKVPMLSVDANDNIKLKGSGNYKILINGKESALMAKNPSDVLKSMPASNIEKIEVITTPPAKYDAEGLAGIINIITKKNADQGYNGNVTLRYNSIFGPGVNFNGTVKQGKFGASGYMGTGYHPDFTSLFSNSQKYFGTGSDLEQSGTNKNHGHYAYVNTELSYEVDSLNLLTGSFNLFRGKFYSNSDQLTDQFNSASGIDEQYSLDNSSASLWKGMDIGINFQHGFKRNKDQMLTLSYKYSYSPSVQNTDAIIADTIKYPFPSYQQYNSSGSKEHTIQLDYTHPLKKVTIEAGGKAILRDNYSNFTNSLLNSSTGQYDLDPAQTNDFNYQQNIYSAYNSYQVKLNKWTGKAGLRLEHTTVNADFTSSGGTLDDNYNNFIPSVSVMRNLKNSSLTLGFTQRIQRPGIWQLNPFVDKSNPKFINTGNPNLKPELDNTFELNFSSFSKVSTTIGLSYAFSNNSIQNVTHLSVDSTNFKAHIKTQPDTITTTTYQNLGSNRTLGLNVNFNLNPSKKVSISLNAQVQHVWLRGTYNGQFYTNQGYTGNAFANMGYKFAKGYRFGIDAGYFSGNVNLQGSTGYFLYNSYVLTKDFFKEKASISFVANCFEKKYWATRSTTRTNDFYQSSITQDPYRTFAIRFNYKFGKLNSDIKRNQHGINNDDTKGGGKSGANQ